jgi:ubiquinone/menaquinone biosynthesis C-methylase UbiE
MKEDITSYSQAAKQLGVALQLECFDQSEVKSVKNQIQDSYGFWANMIYDRAFLNWGLWNKQIFQEYQQLNFNFAQICPVQDIHSQLLLYSLIRPLVQAEFFNKKLLDVGCGNGIGLKLSSELLKTEYAVGLDLVNKLVTNAYGNYYSKNKVNYLQADAENLALESESFDIVTNLESSHLYPNLEHFFAEVERVLIPGGYFCYADIHVTKKRQAQRLEDFVKTRKNLKIVQKIDFTKMVQASIYNRLVASEGTFYSHARAMFGAEEPRLFTETSSLARAMGLTFLPWWKIRLQTPELRPLAKSARKDKYWGKKYFFYYLVQKVT